MTGEPPALPVLAEPVHAVGHAWQQRDEAAAREQLQVLAAEATLLSRMTPLPMPSTLNSPVQVRAERDPEGVPLRARRKRPEASRGVGSLGASPLPKRRLAELPREVVSV